MIQHVKEKIQSTEKEEMTAMMELAIKDCISYSKHTQGCTSNHQHNEERNGVKMIKLKKKTILLEMRDIFLKSGYN